MDNQYSEHTSKAFKIANDLMSFANNEQALGDDIGYGILCGVMRDCAYKIRRAAEQQCLLHKPTENGEIN